MNRVAIILLSTLFGCAIAESSAGTSAESDTEAARKPTVAPVLPPASPGSFSTVTVTGGASSLVVQPNGNTIWDFDALPAAAGDAQELRFFRHTVTTGEVSLVLQQGDGTANAPQVKLSGNSSSFFRKFVGFGVTNPLYHVDIAGLNEKGHTTSNRLLNVDTVNSTFNTTAGPLTSYGGYFNIRSGRSAGTNPLTNVGVYATAAGTAQVKYAAVFDKGDVRINGHVLAMGTTPTVSACGSGPVITGDDKAGTVTEGSGATGCKVTFAATYGTAPTCMVTSRAGLAFTFVTVPLSLTVNNSGALAGTTFDYICAGH